MPAGVLHTQPKHAPRHKKSGIHAREGVSRLWFVDTNARTLEAFGLRKERWVPLAALADGDPVSLPHFDAVNFPLDALRPDGVPDLDEGEE
ncbi:MAG: Uma2 family endonuclease [Rhodobacter sp.]|nr:Uma2 family endonuclease [Rhodobacter sp.]MCY4169457.1 Uma2 family endonuclease [Rhodobacter sp.]